MYTLFCANTLDACVGPTTGTLRMSWKNPLNVVTPGQSKRWETTRSGGEARDSRARMNPESGIGPHTESEVKWSAVMRSEEENEEREGLSIRSQLEKNTMLSFGTSRTVT